MGGPRFFLAALVATAGFADFFRGFSTKYRADPLPVGPVPAHVEIWGTGTGFGKLSGASGVENLILRVKLCPTDPTRAPEVLSGPLSAVGRPGAPRGLLGSSSGPASDRRPARFRRQLRILGKNGDLTEIPWFRKDGI